MKWLLNNDIDILGKLLHAVEGTCNGSAKGVLSAPNVVLHPWLQGELSEVLAEIEKKHPRETLPLESLRPLYAQWETWLGHPSRNPPSLLYALCWCWIIWQDIYPLIWLAGLLITG